MSFVCEIIHSIFTDSNKLKRMRLRIHKFKWMNRRRNCPDAQHTQIENEKEMSNEKIKKKVKSKWNRWSAQVITARNSSKEGGRKRKNERENKKERRIREHRRSNDVSIFDEVSRRFVLSSLFFSFRFCVCVRVARSAAHEIIFPVWKYCFPACSGGI